jgi:hypothetical protein
LSISERCARNLSRMRNGYRTDLGRSAGAFGLLPSGRTY